MEPLDRVKLQEEYGGRFIATRDGEVVASAERHDELVRALQAAGVDAREVVFEYVRPKDEIRVLGSSAVMP